MAPFMCEFAMSLHGSKSLCGKFDKLSNGYRHMDRQTYRHTDTDRQTHRETDRQTADRQTADRQTYRHTDKMTK